MIHTTRSGILCAFSGQEFLIYECGTSFFARADWHYGSIVTNMCPSREQLMSFLRMRAPAVSTPAHEPILTCPYTGLAIAKKDTPAGWIGSVDHPQLSWRTTPLWDERRLDYFLSSRDGTVPAFSRVRLEVVGERKPPAAPATDPDDKAKREELTDAARETVEKLVHASGGAVSGRRDTRARG